MAERIGALDYHELSKHSAVSVRTNQHYLDWDNQPLPFKIYRGLEAVPLPRDFSRQEIGDGSKLDLLNLARLLHFTAGIVREKTLADGSKYYFRAAACTGALYHIDLYVACAELGDLEAGVYHFGPHDFALHRLRRGDHRRLIVDAGGGDAALARAPVVLLCTSTFWRNAWKYQSRTYRHCFWDGGTLLANLLEMTSASQIPAKVVVGFADTAVNELLGLDTMREVALACVALGDVDVAAPAALPLTALAYETMPLSRSEIDYPEIRAAHAGSSFETADEARGFRAQVFERQLPIAAGTLTPLAPPPDPPPLAIEATIVRRGSARHFARAPITYTQLSHILRTAVVAVDADFAARRDARSAGVTLLNDLYLIVNAVDDLAPGTYVYRGDDDALELLREGDFRRDAGYLDLGQELAADAAVNFYALSDLRLVVERLGDRGYRAAALEAAILGGRIYLAAYSLGLGATGLTFFDDDVTAFFSPHAADKGVMFLTAVGRASRGGT